MTHLDELVIVPSREQVERETDRQYARRVWFETLLASKAADLECEHGHCPGTVDPDCECWR